MTKCEPALSLVTLSPVSARWKSSITINATVLKALGVGGAPNQGSSKLKAFRSREPDAKLAPKPQVTSEVHHVEAKHSKEQE